MCYLPQPSKVFIKKYVEAGGIDEVMVDYIEYSDSQTFHIIPKVNSHNEIIIHPIKDSYTREEVEELCKNAWQVGYNIGYHDETEPSHLTKENWIKKNL